MLSRASARQLLVDASADRISGMDYDPRRAGLVLGFHLVLVLWEFSKAVQRYVFIAKGPVQCHPVRARKSSENVLWDGSV